MQNEIRKRNSEEHSNGKNRALKILYAGSPEASARALKILLERAQGVYEIAGVLTNPPSAKGRKKDLLPTAVGEAAQKKNIPVYAPQKLDADFREVIAAQKFDALVCFAYGKIFGPKFLSLFKIGGMNLHPSLLPKYRGPTPIPAAILNMDKETAATVQTLSLGMDEGEILAQEKIALDFTETADSLLEKSARLGADLLDGVLKECARLGKMPQGAAQQGEVSYTKIISREDALINWNENAKKISAFVRAYTSEPGAFTRIGSIDGETLKILKCVPFDENEIANIKIENFSSLKNGTVISFDKKAGILVKCKESVLALTELQRQQRKAMNYKDFMNGERNFLGTVLC
uniref:Methionyl-tRNA formyltransferase n=1 Tax=uncultured Spirochaetaceae bacterium TaxID=201186 RepID=A0A650EPB1_9SPIO|nr:methionyl-tRNA formyltransferase [uncultured Spirochaetaceae bacterium]